MEYPISLYAQAETIASQRNLSWNGYRTQKGISRFDATTSTAVLYLHLSRIDRYKVHNNNNNKQQATTTTTTTAKRSRIMEDRVRAEFLIQRNQQLLDSIVNLDYETYDSFCADDMSCMEPESNQNLVIGKAFHKYYFDVFGGAWSTFCEKTLSIRSATNVQMLGVGNVLAQI